MPHIIVNSNDSNINISNCTDYNNTNIIIIATIITNIIGLLLNNCPPIAPFIFWYTESIPPPGDTSPSILTLFKSIESDFDLVFISADNFDAISLLNTYVSQDVLHFTSARVRKTKFDALTELCKILPVQGLIYE